MIKSDEYITVIRSASQCRRSASRLMHAQQQTFSSYDATEEKEKQEQVLWGTVQKREETEEMEEDTCKEMEEDTCKEMEEDTCKEVEEDTCKEIGYTHIWMELYKTISIGGGGGAK